MVLKRPEPTRTRPLVKKQSFAERCEPRICIDFRSSADISFDWSFDFPEDKGSMDQHPITCPPGFVRPLPPKWPSRWKGGMAEKWHKRKLCAPTCTWRQQYHKESSILDEGWMQRPLPRLEMRRPHQEAGLTKFVGYLDEFRNAMIAYRRLL